MKIKKNCFVLWLCGITLCFFGNSCNNNVDTEKIKQEIVEELKKQPTIVKGDGSSYYAEPIVLGEDMYYIQHSTIKCTNIKLGAVKKDVFMTNKYYNLFCTECMDDRLINHFIERTTSK